MQRFIHKVNDPVGIHARPAGLLVKEVQSLSSNVSVVFGSKKADAKRLFAIMGLGIKQNDIVTFELEGTNEASDCEQLKKFCENNL